MMYPLRDRILVWSLAVLLAAGPIPAVAEDAKAIARALAASGARDWTTAATEAARSGPMGTALIQWQRLRAGQGSWPEYLAFARAHRDWPGMALLYRRGDALLRPDLPPAEIVEWFGDRQPDTLAGAKALITALKATDQTAATAELARFWGSQPLSDADSENFVAIYGAELRGLHDARLASLLDQGEWAAAQKLLPLASVPAQEVGRARIALQAGQAGVDALILALPEPQRDDAGLALDRFRWRARAKMPDLARDLMIERSTSAEALRDPAAWADARADYARAALRRSDWALAEKLAAPHFLPEGDESFIDLEWIAGYAALKQGAFDRALGHFKRLEAGVTSPISLARAFYWQGRSQEAAGRTDEARAAYGHAATWQTAYYGQLAAEKLGQPMQPALAQPGLAADSLPDWRGSKLRFDPVWQAGVWLLAAGDTDQAGRFFLHLAETADPEDIGRMARLMLEVRRPWYALRLAKAAAAKGVIYPAAYFPLTGLEKTTFGLPPELVMAIARRESEFNHTVSSHAGALGLMQVMPETARAMARKVGEPFEQGRLTQDGAYNARLGSAYLAGLRERFGISIALVSSGYNAGPGRPARWLDDFGDLRRSADPVDWVEMIPLDETRNYVMRVAEALPIYRARIMGHPAPIVPTFDLTGGGMMPVPPQPPIRLAFSSRPPMSARALAFMGAGGVLAEVVRPALVIEEASAAASLPAGAAISPALPSPAAETATR
ncbi:lytic transglycosylase domain-containing protein [Paracoccus sp. CPCC 101403]|uniref:Lytic transglycosylase domain-containing protein n=1 Tax=Paracoccus broussonetiae TaxID=3075834 RepID=A0ABU3E8G7_9RHOB|nr:lytic transglycosylase domain-containing protein [Paracoccus sp. CPCC 101403]MDT1060508.1 lytic transglycosylase domain-containing protein [Paracoccus sp. CPCC 101403]